MKPEELEGYHQEIADGWQVCVDNTSYDDVDGCDFIESGLDEYEVESIIDSFNGVVLTKEQHTGYLEMEELLFIIEENWPDTIDYANDLLKEMETK